MKLQDTRHHFLGTLCRSCYHLLGTCCWTFWSPHSYFSFLLQIDTSLPLILSHAVIWRQSTTDATTFCCKMGKSTALYSFFTRNLVIITKYVPNKITFLARIPDRRFTILKHSQAIQVCLSKEFLKVWTVDIV